MIDKEKMDEIASSGMTAEELSAAWEQYVRDEVSALLDIFLPEAVNGNVGVLYIRPVKKVDARTDTVIFDDKKATGVDIHIVFEFPETIEFFEEEPSE